MKAPTLPATEVAEKILASLRARDARIITAESCTGGLIASRLTDVPGASDVVWGGLVTYQASAKQTLLNVSAEVLNVYGEVSAETALAMAEGALALLPPGAGCAVATTGNAGPSGEPVGLVWIGTAVRNGSVKAIRCEFDPALGREELKAAFAQAALEALAGNLLFQ